MSPARHSQVATIIRRLVHSRSHGATENSEQEQQADQESGSAEFGEVLQVVVVGKVDCVHGGDGLVSREYGFVGSQATAEQGEGLDETKGVAPHQGAHIGGDCVGGSQLGVALDEGVGGEGEECHQGERGERCDGEPAFPTLALRAERQRSDGEEGGEGREEGHAGEGVQNRDQDEGGDEQEGAGFQRGGGGVDVTRWIALEGGDGVENGEGEAHLQEAGEVVAVDVRASGETLRAGEVGLEKAQGCFERGDCDERERGEPRPITPMPGEGADEQEDQEVAADTHEMFDGEGRFSGQRGKSGGAQEGRGGREEIGAGGGEDSEQGLGQRQELCQGKNGEGQEEVLREAVEGRGFLLPGAPAVQEGEEGFGKEADVPVAGPDCTFVEDCVGQGEGEDGQGAEGHVAGPRMDRRKARIHFDGEGDGGLPAGWSLSAPWGATTAEAAAAAPPRTIYFPVPASRVSRGLLCLSTSIFSLVFSAITKRLPSWNTMVAGAECVTMTSPAFTGHAGMPATETVAPFSSKGWLLETDPRGAE